MSSLDLKMAGLRSKMAPEKEGTTGPRPEEFKEKLNGSSAIPPANSGIHTSTTPSSAQAPEQRSEQTQSNTTSMPEVKSAPTDVRPLDISDSAKPAEPELASVDEPKVTSAFLPQDNVQLTPSLDLPPRESPAENGRDGKLIGSSDSIKSPLAAPESPINAKAAGTGLRLNTQGASDDKWSASTATKRDSTGSDNKTPLTSVRPPLVDMRASSASPKTPGFGFGAAGLGTNFAPGRFNAGRVGFAGGFGFRPGPSPMSTPIGEGPGSIGKSPNDEQNNDRDDLSSVVEGSEPQDVDSFVDEPQVEAALNPPLFPRLMPHLCRPQSLRQLSPSLPPILSKLSPRCSNPMTRLLLRCQILEARCRSPWIHRP
jgi:hypothetical protein